MSEPGHLERTAKEPRDPSLHTVILSRIDQINETVRVFRLQIPDGAPAIRFLPGQWVDLYCPGVALAGGFTITSPPSRAAAAKGPDGEAGYVELAVQTSPDGAPAQWLWRPQAQIAGAALDLRTGGSFVYPPPGVPAFALRRLVFVAGGVGVNPLMSMVSHFAEQRPDAARVEVSFLYSMRADPSTSPRRMLFLERLAGLFASGQLKGRLTLFLTAGAAEDGGGGGGTVSCSGVDVPFLRRRIAAADVADAVGHQHRRFAAVYVCGVPAMTDQLVESLTSPEGFGMESHRVLSEKWW